MTFFFFFKFFSEMLLIQYRVSLEKVNYILLLAELKSVAAVQKSSGTYYNKEGTTQEFHNQVDDKCRETGSVDKPECDSVCEESVAFEGQHYKEFFFLICFYRLIPSCIVEKL